MVQAYSLSLSLSLSIRTHTESAFFHLATTCTLEKPQLGGRRYMVR